MLRSVLGAVLGYLVIAVLVGALLFGAYAVLGTERSFRPRSYEPSTLWLILMLAVNFVAAVIGGLVARKVGGGGGVKVLLALLIVLSLGMTVYAVTSDAGDPGERTGDVASTEAMRVARTPVWAMLAGLGAGVLGVLAGAARAGGRKR